MQKNKKAFTLIELLVVVLIIGILAAIAVPSYQKAVAKARYSELIPVVNALAQAQEVYYLANDSYATTFDELDVDVPVGGTMNETHTQIRYGNKGIEYVWINSRMVGNTKDNTYEVVSSHVQTWPGRKFCYARTTRGQSVCKALGWQYEESSGNYYQN
ncbi:MAG: prepilin-type N-terminal cleavage/methylation domain-containing protein [Elusimicrobiaceae bacterium]|nr:prepilin-type N-terminal cleavage/methylation domain-containing protein [Elusimicrobiaceae bacterium]